MTATLEQLVESGRLERVPKDRDRAQRQLTGAGRHLEAARLVVDVDPSGAYQLAYEAARKAVVAHMVARGLRVRATDGAHQAVGVYALTLPGAHQFAAFDRMRRNRNRSAYATRVFSRTEVETDLDEAEAMVEAISRLLAASG